MLLINNRKSPPGDLKNGIFVVVPLKCLNNPVFVRITEPSQVRYLLIKPGNRRLTVNPFTHLIAQRVEVNAGHLLSELKFRA